MWLHRTWQVKRTLHPQVFNSILHHLEVNRDHAGHLNCSTERDLAIALREVQVANTEFGAFYVNREIDF
jgi:hypothetical protein